MLSRRRVVLGSLCAFAAFLIGGALPAFASTAPVMTTVQVPERLCAAALPGQMSCDAIALRTERVSSAEAEKLRAVGIAPAAAPSAGAGPKGGYSPGQLAGAYGVNPATATTQTVAIVDAYADPSVTADLDHFDANYGLPAETSTSFKVVSQTGGSVSGVHTDVGWSGEITLDVEAVRGVCHACKILLVEANSSSGSDLAAGVNYAAAHASIVSNSYGGPEFAGDSDVSAYNHAGVAILASTGDHGWYGWDVFNEGSMPPQAPQVPASYNTVVGVGGTRLTLTSGGNRASETVWNDNGVDDNPGFGDGIAFGATGGGCSSIYSAQTWQQDVAGYSSLGCGATLRNGVDVAADADYMTGFDTYETTSWCTTTDGNGNSCPSMDPGWQTIGGTSLSSPLVSAMWALAGGPAGVKYPALTLYGHFHSSPSQLFDVTSGGNAACGGDTASGCDSQNLNQQFGVLLDCMWGTTGTTVLTNIGQCNARTGYDGVSGVGTPTGVADFQPLSPTAAIASPGTVRVGAAHTFSASGSVAPFPGDSITQYKWSWGDGATSTTSSASASHTYTSTGAKTIALTVTDSDSSLNDGRTGSKSIQVTVQSAAAKKACIVPKLKGKTVKAAKSALTKAHCKEGKVSKKFSKVEKGHVISQKPGSGKHESAGTKVSLVVSKGKKK
jgi:subtilase family serine protease